MRENMIYLNFDSTLRGLAGYQFGAETYLKQVKNKLSKDSINVLFFPETIDKVAISFVQGFWGRIIQDNCNLDKITIKGNEKFVEKFYQVK